MYKEGTVCLYMINVRVHSMVLKIEVVVEAANLFTSKGPGSTGQQKCPRSSLR